MDDRDKRYRAFLNYNQPKRNFFQRVVDQVNPFDGGRSFGRAQSDRDLARRSIEDANRRLQTQQPRYGVLRDPNARRNFTQSQAKMPTVAPKDVLGAYFNARNKVGTGIRDFAVDTARDTARNVAATGITAGNTITRLSTGGRYNPNIRLNNNSGISKIVFGSEPVEGFKKEGERANIPGFRSGKPAAVVGGVFAGLDLIPGGGKVARRGAKLLSKLDNVDEIIDVAKKLKINLADDEVRVISQTTDQKQIRGILDDAIKRDRDAAKLGSQVRQPGRVDDVITDTTKVADNVKLPVRGVSDVATSVTDDLVQGFKQAKTPQHTDDAVRALFPNLNDVEARRVSQELAKATDDTQIKKIIEQAQGRRTAVSETIQKATPDEAIPVKGTQAAADAELQQLVDEGQIAPQAIKQTDEVTGSVVRQGDTPAQATKVPGAVDANRLSGTKLEANIASEVEKELKRFDKNLKLDDINVIGSVARGQARPDSDLDILITPNRDFYTGSTGDAPEQVIRNIEERLQKLFNREVQVNVGRLDEAPGEASKRLADITDELKTPENTLMARASESAKRILNLGERGGAEAGDIPGLNRLIKDEGAGKVAPQTLPEVPPNLSPSQMSPGSLPNDTITDAVRAAEEARASTQSLPERLYKGVKQELFDPKQEYQRLDDQFAKANKIKPQDIKPSESLVYLSRQIENSPQEAVLLAQKPTRTGESLAQVMNRYPGDEQRNFMQYLNQKFSLEIYDKAGKKSNMWKVENATPEQVQASIKQFEQANPQVVKDAATVKAWADELIDKGVQSGEISKEFGEAIKAKYQNYVPLSKVFSEDLVRPKIVGGLGTSVGEQNVVRFLGEGATAFDDSFETLITRGEQVVKKANANVFNNELLRRADTGQIGNRVKKLVDPEVGVAQKQSKERLNELREILRKEKSGRNKLATKSRLAKKDVIQARTEAAERARQYYAEASAPGKGAWVNKLSQDELVDMFKLMTDTNEVSAKRIATKLSKKSGAADTAIKDLMKARENVNKLQSEARDAFKATRELQQNVPTGKNVIRGFKNGEPFALELDAGLAKQNEYLNSLKDDQIGRLSGAIAAPSKVLYTGALAPQFAAKQVIRNQGLKLTNAPGLSAFGARPLTTGYFGGLTGQGQFYKKLLDNGYTPPVGTQVAKTPKLTAEGIASSVDLGSRLKYKATRPREWWNTLNKLAGKLDDADRVQIAKGEYIRRINQGVPEDEAIKYAARMANEAIGDFQRVSKLARRAEGILPYSGATQAGHRALMRRFRTNPVETGVKVATLMGAVTGVAAYSADKAQDYYEDMIESGRTFDLDNNIVIVTPGAHKDPKTGEWTGIIKIPVAPDYNPLTRAAWRTGYAASKGETPDVGMIANELKNFLTADQQKNFVDTSGGREGLGRFLPGSPIKNTLMVLSGVNSRTGETLAGDRLSQKPRTEQYTKFTTENAKTISRAFGGILTPQQVDAIADASGFLGDIVQSRNGTRLTITEPFKKIIFGSKGQSDGAKYYDDVKEVGKQFTDDKQWELWQAMKTSRTNLKGEKTEAGLLDSAQKSFTLLSNEEVLNAEMEMNRRSAERSGKSNPLLDETLTPDQRNKVLTYRSMKINNSAKQNYTKNGESAFISLGLDEPWYQEFQKKENAYWKSVLGRNEEDDTIKTFSGKPKPEASPELQAKLDFYYTLPKGTGDRSRFLRANPDVLKLWDEQNDFTNEERVALGFNRLTEDEGFGGSGGRGRFGSGGDKEKTNRLYLTQLLGEAPNVNVNDVQISTKTNRARVKIKKPGKARIRRIRLD